MKTNKKRIISIIILIVLLVSSIIILIIQRNNIILLEKQVAEKIELTTHGNVYSIRFKVDRSAVTNQHITITIGSQMEYDYLISLYGEEFPIFYTIKSMLLIIDEYNICELKINYYDTRNQSKIYIFDRMHIEYLDLL